MSPSIRPYVHPQFVAGVSFAATNPVPVYVSKLPSWMAASAEPAATVVATAGAASVSTPPRTSISFTSSGTDSSWTFPAPDFANVPLPASEKYERWSPSATRPEWMRFPAAASTATSSRMTTVPLLIARVPAKADASR